MKKLAVALVLAVTLISGSPVLENDAHANSQQSQDVINEGNEYLDDNNKQAWNLALKRSWVSAWKYMVHTYEKMDILDKVLGVVESED